MPLPAPLIANMPRADIFHTGSRMRTTPRNEINTAVVLAAPVHSLMHTPLATMRAKTAAVFSRVAHSKTMATR